MGSSGHGFLSGLKEVSIPKAVLANAKGLAIFSVIKAGFIWSGKAGDGVVIARLPDGTWSAPSCIVTGGVGFGLQIGADVSEYCIVMNTEEGVRSFAQAGNLTIGGSFSASAGPVGTGQSVQAALTSPAPLYTYCQSQGLYAGAALDGAGLMERRRANQRFYGQEVTARQILNGSIPPPQAAAGIYKILEDAMKVDETAVPQRNFVPAPYLSPAQHQYEAQPPANYSGYVQAPPVGYGGYAFSAAPAPPRPQYATGGARPVPPPPVHQAPPAEEQSPVPGEQTHAPEKTVWQLRQEQPPLPRRQPDKNDKPPLPPRHPDKHETSASQQQDAPRQHATNERYEHAPPLPKEYPETYRPVAEEHRARTQPGQPYDPSGARGEPRQQAYQPYRPMEGYERPAQYPTQTYQGEYATQEPWTRGSYEPYQAPAPQAGAGGYRQYQGYQAPLHAQSPR